MKGITAEHFKKKQQEQKVLSNLLDFTLVESILKDTLEGASMQSSLSDGRVKIAIGEMRMITDVEGIDRYIAHKLTDQNLNYIRQQLEERGFKVSVMHEGKGEGAITISWDQ